MQYETIILELMSRIKILESDVASLKEAVCRLEGASLPADASATVKDSAPHHSSAYRKMTDRMMDICYGYGKKAYLTPDANIGDYADSAAEEADMNRSSAFMYIYAVKRLLSGEVFKRAVSMKALRKYFSLIYEDFGKTGLANALKATRANIEYRSRYNLPVDSIAALCEEFQSKI